MSSRDAQQTNAPSHVRGDIAIVGMSCLFPGAPDLATYWQNIVSKVDAVTDPPPEAWNADVFYDPESTNGERLYCKKGGFIGPLAFFDPLSNGVMPLTVKGGEPDQWLALKVAREALADAGYSDTIPERQRTAVILGKGSHINSGNFNVVQHGAVIDQTLDIVQKLHPEYSEGDLHTLRHALLQHLPTFNADTVGGLIPNITAGRIANRLDLMGPNYTVDAACASSFIALEMAVQNLLTGQCDLALVGGVHVVTPVPILMVFCHLGALSRNQQIRPFDKQADGTILGEGIGMVVLKRRADAERDGNRIYAIIKGVGTSSDGRALGVTAPRFEGEVLALERAYAMAGVSPRTVGLIEAHGTGTPVGDATEIDALNHMLGARGGDEPWCALGSVKSMVGHLMHTAGMAGLIKTALALHHKVLPPTLHVDEPHPKLEQPDTPLYVNTEARPWIHGGETPRRAGVDAFGFGGINAHVVLEEYVAADETKQLSHHLHWDTEVCIVSASSREALIQRAQHIQQFLQAAPPLQLKDLAYTLNTALDGPFRIAVVASTIEEVQQKLNRAIERLADPKCRKIQDIRGTYFTEQPLAQAGKLALLFPGEGSQYVNMLADLCLHFPEIRHRFDVMDQILGDAAQQYTPSRFTFPRPMFSDEQRQASEERLWQMKGAIAVVLAADTGLAMLLDKLQIKPDALLGHSTGEYPALLTAGVYDVQTDDQLARIAADLYRVYQDGMVGSDVPPATLLAVSAGAETVTSVMEQVGGGSDLFIGMDNCPHQTVLVGPDDTIERVGALLRAQGILHERLPFDRPYHTPLFKGFSPPLRAFIERWFTAPPNTPIYSCTTTERFPDDLAQVREIALEHWMAPVRFRETIEQMYANGVRIFVEAGPRGNLTAFVGDILRGKPHLAVPANVTHRSGITQLNHLVGLLAVHGVPMDANYLYARRAPRTVYFDQPDNPYGEPKSATLMKLRTAWPLIELSDEEAAQLRGQLARAPAQPTSTTPVAAPQASVAPTPTPERASPTSPAPTARPAAPTAAPAPHAQQPEPVQPAPLTNGAHVAVPATAPAVALPTVAPSGADQVMSAYLQTMEQFLAVQQTTMQSFLGAASMLPAPALPTPAPVLPSTPATASHTNGHAPVAATPITQAVTAEPPTAPAPTPAMPEVVEVETAAPAAPLTADGITTMLLQLVAERTGYPVEMLNLNLDLEADLGIDSIKRIEILGAFQRQAELLTADDMEALASQKTLRDVIDFLAAHQQASPAAHPAGPAGPRDTPRPELVEELPLLDTIVALTPGEQVVARRTFTLDEDVFIKDHSFGRNISSTDPSLAGLPVMPFTASMEMLAEAAALLIPGQRLVAMRDVRTYSWILLRDKQLTLQITARRSAAAPHEVQAHMHEIPPGSSAVDPHAPPLFEGVMIFADGYADAPLAEPFTIPNERPSMWTPEQLYRDVAFHGPAFRGVVSMDGINTERARASLLVLPSDQLLRSNPQPRFVTDPIFLDQPGQVVGFWMYDRVDAAAIMFPARMEHLELFGPPLAAGERSQCRVLHVELIGDTQARADWEVVREDGRVWARCRGWEGRRFDVPRALVLFAFYPHERMLSAPWPDGVAAPLANAGVQSYRISVDDFPPGFFTNHQGVWQTTLAHLTLGRKERDTWRALNWPPIRRLEWLLGRVVAKDAVRAHLQQQYGMILSPADIEIMPDEHGRPTIQGAWTSQVPQLPLLTIAHTSQAAVALVGNSEAGAGIGVDIEDISRMNQDVEQVAFTPEEQALLRAATGDAYQEWLVRCWCAKEAAGKAIGRGLGGGPRTVVIQAVDIASGGVQLGLSGELARQAPIDQPLMAHTARQDTLIFANVLYQPTRKE